MMKRVWIGWFMVISASVWIGFVMPIQSNLALQKGDIAPDFTELSTAGNQITLSQKVETGNVVILFYQGFWCTGCHKSLSHFKDDLAKVTQKGGHTIAITPTPLSGYPADKEKQSDDVSIIIDKDLSLMKQFGVIDQTQTNYIRGNKNHGQHDFSFIPATYIIDENMKIKFAHVDPNFTINAFVDSLLIHP